MRSILVSYYDLIFIFLLKVQVNDIQDPESFAFQILK